MATNEERAAGATAAPVEPFINKKELARRLQKQVRTVDNWMAAGILPYYKIKRSVQFKWSEVEGSLRKYCRVGRG